MSPVALEGAPAPFRTFVISVSFKSLPPGRTPMNVHVSSTIANYAKPTRWTRSREAAQLFTPRVSATPHRPMSSSQQSRRSTVSILPNIGRDVPRQTPAQVRLRLNSATCPAIPDQRLTTTGVHGHLAAYRDHKRISYLEPRPTQLMYCPPAPRPGSCFPPCDAPSVLESFSLFIHRAPHPGEDISAAGNCGKRE